MVSTVKCTIPVCGHRVAAESSLDKLQIIRHFAGVAATHEVQSGDSTNGYSTREQLNSNSANQ